MHGPFIPSNPPRRPFPFLHHTGHVYSAVIFVDVPFANTAWHSSPPPATNSAAPGITYSPKELRVDRRLIQVAKRSNHFENNSLFLMVTAESSFLQPFISAQTLPRT